MKTGKHKPKRYAVRFDTGKFMDDVNTKRLDLGWIWSEVAEATGISLSTLSHIYIGKIGAPGAHIMVSLLDWLGRTDIGSYMIRMSIDDEETDEVTSE